jgi:hypothetical protein
MDRESRLDDLRRQAERTGAISAPGVRPAGAPFPVADAAGAMVILTALAFLERR